MPTRMAMSLCFLAGLFMSAALLQVPLGSGLASAQSPAATAPLPQPPTNEQDPSIRFLTARVPLGEAYKSVLVRSLGKNDLCPPSDSPAQYGASCVALVTDSYVRQLVSASVANALRQAAIDQVADERMAEAFDSRIRAANALQANPTIQELVGRVEALERRMNASPKQIPSEHESN